MKKITHLIVVMGIFALSSCENDLNNQVQPVCATNTAPQQIVLDWSQNDPSYFEVDPTTNEQNACTLEPFYGQNPPFATSYNYTTQASDIPNGTLLPSDPNDHSNAQKNELGIVQSGSNYLCQITVQSLETGEDNCTYNGQNQTGPVYTTTWSTAGAIGKAPLYTFSTTSSANGQSYLNNQVIIDYFDVYSQCSEVNERPYFSGVTQVNLPPGAPANYTLVTVAMYNENPVTQ